MRITKIHTAGSDYLICRETEALSGAEISQRLLDRRCGIGADGLVFIDSAGEMPRLRLFLPDGSEAKSSATALVAAAKFLYDEDSSRRHSRLRLGEVDYTVRLSVLGGRVLCGWLDLPPIRPKPMEQLKYYHGIRGEVLRACMAHPRVSLYSLCGEHAVFLLESPRALRGLAMRDVCTRLSEVLFYDESIDLHFSALSGDNALSMRSWRCGVGEVTASGEGAALCAYAASESEWTDGARTIVRSLGGSFCVELDGHSASLCAKCETVFVGETA